MDNAALWEATDGLCLSDTNLNTLILNTGADFPLHKYALVPYIKKGDKEERTVSGNTEAICCCEYIYLSIMQLKYITYKWRRLSYTYAKYVV